METNRKRTERSMDKSYIINERHIYDDAERKKVRVNQQRIGEIEGDEVPDNEEALTQKQKEEEIIILKDSKQMDLEVKSGDLVDSQSYNNQIKHQNSNSSEILKDLSKKTNMSQEPPVEMEEDSEYDDEYEVTIHYIIPENDDFINFDYTQIIQKDQSKLQASSEAFIMSLLRQLQSQNRGVIE